MKLYFILLVLNLLCKTYLIKNKLKTNHINKNSWVKNVKLHIRNWDNVKALNKVDNTIIKLDSKDKDDHPDSNKTQINEHPDSNKTQINDHPDSNKTQINEHPDSNKTQINDHLDSNKTQINEHPDSNKAQINESNDSNKTQINKHYDPNKAHIYEPNDSNKTQINKHYDPNKAHIYEPNDTNKAQINEHNDPNKTQINKPNNPNNNDNKISPVILKEAQSLYEKMDNLQNTINSVIKEHNNLIDKYNNSNFYTNYEQYYNKCLIKPDLNCNKNELEYIQLLSSIEDIKTSIDKINNKFN